ncbi:MULTISPECIES: TIGR00297 family protein [Okeania]|uniref:TIGR00297 family protein n=1 Tax=Okeania hirsuta TaxID=1458930 RepID=A0A3N6PPD0_9CYAN|nr:MULTISPECIES: TIGR00297 family protein [Okeania]NEP06634.1 TIGR00297 family protein [Okeania sp. SIO4D6]NEP42889.1 TIGR00297 family protein [Okeania sp. SIO2H7]NET15469.1 TIGR00297 family protein [Okeania sp. SIO1H6]NEP75000.1 TIGR00297 family protein [Okeania sp. SIO2G5]NEP94524.1 TIGR00297 family protein [Okeania sp. SIO2F5]
MFSAINSINPWLIAISLNTILLSLVYFAPKKLLTPAGILHAWILGVIIWGSLGWPGYLVVAFYFLVGSGVTRIGMAQKQAAGIAEKREGARGPENVWGSALTAAICAVGVWIIGLLYPNHPPIENLPFLLMLGYVASFSTKLSDTCASEVGKAYGKRTFLITTLQPVPRGTEGAVSLEGTLAGIVASVAIALVGWSVGLIDLTGIAFCVLAAFIATNLESVIGATVQSQFEWLTNEIVNIINTLIGAIAAILLAIVWYYALVSIQPSAISYQQF